MSDTANDPTSQINGDFAPVRPATEDADAWKAYWQAQGMPWRTEPEIPTERQAYFSERRAITPDIQQGIYPFKGVEPKLTRADIEWLLATHSDGRGPVQWDEERNKDPDYQRWGLKLRGADVRQLNLRGLPLAHTMAGLSSLFWLNPTEEQRTAAEARLDGANLEGAHLEGSDFSRAHLEWANLDRAHLEGVDLSQAHLDRATLRYAHLEGSNLERATLAHPDGTDCTGAYFEGVNLYDTHLERAILSETQMEGASFILAHLQEAILTNEHLPGALFAEAHMEGAHFTGAHFEGKTYPPGDMGFERIWRTTSSFPRLLPPTDLRLAYFGTGTSLFGAQSGAAQFGFVTVADARWAVST